MTLLAESNPLQALKDGETQLVKHLTIQLLTLTMFFMVPATRAADSINWGTATNIVGDSDVVTNGSLLYAYNLGSTGVQSTTVNGVTFAPWAFPANNTTNTSTIGSVNFTENAGQLISSNLLGTGSGSFAALSSSYRNLLSTGGSATLPTTLTLTLNGLTVGVDYIFQWWINNSSQAVTPNSDPMLLTTATVGSSFVNLNGNVGNTNGNLGQYVVGTFTATATSKLIDFSGTSGGNSPLVNAFQIRVVPEPSTWALVGAATAILGLASRRGKRAKG